MERRAALAIGLSLLILYLYQAFVLPPQPAPAEQQAGAPAASAPAAPGRPVEALQPTPVAPAPSAAAPEAVTADTAEREIVVDNGVVEAVFTNRGARLLHWRLKRYLGDGGAPVDLVPGNLPPELPRPLSLTLADADATTRANTALYRVTGDTGGRLDVRDAPGRLVFEYEDAAGLRLRKEIEFAPNSYVFTFSPTVTQAGGPVMPVIQWGPGLGDVGARSAGGSFFTGNYVQPPSAIYERDGDVTRVVPDSIAEERVHEGTFAFVGVDDHYFLVAAIEPGRARVEYDTVSSPASEDAGRRFVSHSLALAGEPRPVKVFAGPKALETLQAAGAGGALAEAINFGIFTWLVIPLLSALKWLYGFVGNYGWAIVLLTIVINLAMFPLRHKSLVSMRRMQALQPQIKAIQERYADLKMTDPARQKMNTEVMNLYREKGVNPASGCVPMLLTMPVLLAFYSMLSQSIELRGADFGFWIHDLSQKDPYYVTPLLMGATMFWQQWVTPTSADPAQQRMMMFMPLLLTGIFVSLPSGLAIYYLISNMCQIGQQYMTNRLIGKPPAIPARAAAGGSKLKNAGAGKTSGAASVKPGDRKA